MVDFVISTEHQLVIERFNGLVNFELIKKASEAIWAHPNYVATYKGLVDIRGCEVETSIAELSKAAYFFLKNAHTAKGFMVILADSNHSIAKSFIFNYKVSKVMNIHVSSNFDEAMRNLGVTQDTYDLINSTEAQSVE
jgi:hypothetical protein